MKILDVIKIKGFSWRITTSIRSHGGEDSMERVVDLEFQRQGETYWHTAESYKEETGRSIPASVAKEYDECAMAFADKPRSAHGLPLAPGRSNSGNAKTK